MGSLEELDKAIQEIEDALGVTATGHAERARMLPNIGSYPANQIPSETPHRATIYQNIGNYLYIRYQWSGSIGDLNNGIEAFEKAVAATPADYPSPVLILVALGDLFYKRFKRSGATEDIEKAVQVMEEVLVVIPKDDPNHSIALHNLSAMLCGRYDRLGEMADLERGIYAAEQAAALVPPDHPKRAAYLNCTGCCYYTKFLSVGNVADLERAIQECEEAVTTKAQDNDTRAAIYHNLGNIYFRKYLLLERIADLEKAIQASKLAMEAIPTDHVNQGPVLEFLASLLDMKFFKTNSGIDFVSATALSLKAWRCMSSPPRNRIRAGINAAYRLSIFTRWAEANFLYEAIVKTLPQLSLRFLGRDDQEYVLSQLFPVSGRAVSIALYAGSTASHCLGLLELGRGIILGLVIDCRSDISELRLKHLNIYNTYNRLRTEIDPPRSHIQRGAYDTTSEVSRRSRLQAINEIDDLLVCIRQLPDFEGFLLPPSPETLVAMTMEGPIVIFNTSMFRSDAIIMATGGIKSIRLPQLEYSEVKDRMKRLHSLVRGKRATYSSRTEQLDQLLLWLWNVAVKPVFDELKLGPVKDGSLPHIWWIGVGPLAMAPFHAAGDHSPGSTSNTISRAISSYIPTLKALTYAREKKLHLGPDSSLLLVAMPTTPDTPATPDTPGKKWNPLKNVVKEVEDIVNVVQSQTKTTQLYSPTATHVLNELPGFHAIHFACHGVSDAQRPSNNHLLLHGDNGPEKITVGAIAKLNIQTAQLAYLSACSTAENSSAALADESIHIASGFQLAGFSHVLGTRWNSNDSACRQVAVDFYRELFNEEAHDKGHLAVSTAFHLAVRRLRQDYLRQPIIWASFIHTGA